MAGYILIEDLSSKYKNKTQELSREEAFIKVTVYIRESCFSKWGHENNL